MKNMSYAKHRHKCDQLWMELFQAEIFDHIDPPDLDVSDILEELNQVVIGHDPNEVRSKTDDDLLFIMQLAQMAVYELTVHGAGVTSFRKQRPTTDDKDNRMDMNNDG